MFEPPAKSPKFPEKGTLASFTQVILCYFDEVRGHQPLASFPDKDLIYDEVAVKPLFIHSVWFLSVEEQEEFDHIDLEYSGRTFLAKKFRAPSDRKKERAGCEEDDFETIVLFVSVPDELSVIGSDVLKNLYDAIRQSLLEDLHKLVKGDICRTKPIKTPQIRESLVEAEEVKERFYKVCEWNLAHMSANMIRKISDSVTKQKALSYLMLVNGENHGANAADSSLFDISEGTTSTIGPLIGVSSINFCAEKECIEVILVNNLEADIESAKILVSNVQGFFEKSFFEQDVEFWFSHEEIMLKFPLLQDVRDYIIIVEEKGGRKLLNKKIDVSEIVK
ncbi:MAG TPA: hypothetical protein VKK79_09375 [Candidatus Lokiarchaeia archaeon]|nr:hypothetical protein [Candidatus Lokiarchaeia archaeon]